MCLCVCVSVCLCVCVCARACACRSSGERRYTFAFRDCCWWAQDQCRRQGRLCQLHSKRHRNGPSRHIIAQCGAIVNQHHRGDVGRASRTHGALRFLFTRLHTQTLSQHSEHVNFRQLLIFRRSSLHRWRLQCVTFGQQGTCRRHQFASWRMQ